MLKKHLNKNNLHHAYLIEGDRENILAELFVFLKDIGINTIGNPDFSYINIDNFKINQAFLLRDMSNQKSFSDNKKIFVISANSFSPDAQGALLKMFEDPKENTHFFIIVPEVDALIRTLVSRFYLIKNEIKNLDNKEIEDFLKSSLSARIEYIKNLLAEAEEDVETEEDIEKDLGLESKRSKALKFLNLLEQSLYNKFSSIGHQESLYLTPIDFFEQIFKARKYIRQPGSSAKTFLESVALSIPEKI